MTLSSFLGKMGDSQYSEFYHISLPDFCIGGMKHSRELYSHRPKGLWRCCVLLSELTEFWNNSCLLELSVLLRKLGSKEEISLIQKTEDSGAVHLHTHPPPTYIHSHTYTSINYIFKSSLPIFTSSLLNLSTKNGTLFY